MVESVVRPGRIPANICLSGANCSRHYLCRHLRPVRVRQRLKRRHEAVIGYKIRSEIDCVRLLRPRFRAYSFDRQHKDRVMLLHIVHRKRRRIAVAAGRLQAHLRQNAQCSLKHLKAHPSHQYPALRKFDEVFIPSQQRFDLRQSIEVRSRDKSWTAVLQPSQLEGPSPPSAFDAYALLAQPEPSQHSRESAKQQIPAVCRM